MNTSKSFSIDLRFCDDGARWTVEKSIRSDGVEFLTFLRDDRHCFGINTDEAGGIDFVISKLAQALQQLADAEL